MFERVILIKKKFPKIHLWPAKFLFYLPNLLCCMSGEELADNESGFFPFAAFGFQISQINYSEFRMG